MPKSRKKPKPRGCLPRGSCLPSTASVPEQRYAERLDQQLSGGTIAEWGYEPETFLLARACKETGTRACTYTPDFRVLAHDGAVHFVEVKPGQKRKGKPTYFARDDAKIKMKMFCELHPYPLVVAYEIKGGGWVEQTL